MAQSKGYKRSPRPETYPALEASVIVPALPADEAQRLETLRGLHLLDTPAEERFDRLTRIAQRLFGVPISLVSLVDEQRQWFKSTQGLDARETPRDISFCGHAVLGDEVFVVPDARQDRRFFDNPLVSGDPNIRFYAGCPLRALNGRKLGTVCIIDRQPREFSEEDSRILSDLTLMVERELAAIEMATVDELTTLANRRGFRMLGQHMIDVCRLRQEPASLVYFDLNKFKSINDTYGHAEGDAVLSNFADLMRRCLRSTDLLARLGGDEFVVLLPGADLIQTGQLMEGFVDRMRLHNEQHQLSRGYEIAFSWGAVAFDSAHHDTIDQLMAAGDALMYQRKRQR